MKQNGDNPLSTDYTGLEVAIIGMVGRFPGAKTIDQFWQNLRNGVESISFFSDSELEASGIGSSVIKDPTYVKAKGILEDIDLFDASFFNYSPREAEIIDPQQRLFLESAWEALESAGYDSEQYGGLIGVYAGLGMNTYLANLFSNSDLINSAGGLQIGIGSDKDFLTTRVSYKLNLKGPSIVVQAACATSLVAVHLASQGLLNGECDMALAGGVTLGVPNKTGYFYKSGGILSADGHCRAFDARAQGTIAGNGLGIVVLKRLEDALSDGDCIRAVIKGSAVNNDGALKLGYSAPGIDGQARVTSAALRAAEVEPETITYIEAHGTGTELGDPIEIAALTRAFRARSALKNFCAIGSVKPNIGHLDTASGAASLIKVALALENKLLPSSLNFSEPNPRIDFANSPFYVNAALSEWKTNGVPRRAAVHSFAIGGTNAHIILEEAPAQQPSPSPGSDQLLVLSARTDSALETATSNLAEHLRQHPALNLADVAFTLQVGRRMFSHRRILVCRDAADAVEALEARDLQRVVSAVSGGDDRPVAFIFPGHGFPVKTGMELYQAQPVFHEQVDRCAALLEHSLGIDLRDAFHSDDRKVEEVERQLQISVSQSTLFTIEYALAQLWISWGVRPHLMIGDGIGEYVAACLAGVFSLEDALTFVATSSPNAAHISVDLQIPTIPFISGKTGSSITNAEATDPSFWTRAQVEPAHTDESLGQLGDEPDTILLQIGPRETMSESATQHFDKAVKQVVVSSLPGPFDQTHETTFLLETLGRLLINGASVDWAGFHQAEPRRRLPLPTYPFERKRFWVERRNLVDAITTDQKEIRKNPNIAEWFYLPSWKRALLSYGPKDEGLLAERGCWLIFLDSYEFGSQIVDQLTRQEHDVITVEVGERFTELGDSRYAINPYELSDYDSLFNKLLALERTPRVVVHLWNINPECASPQEAELRQKSQELEYFSLRFLAQSLGSHVITRPVSMHVISNNMQDLTGEEGLCPEKATLLDVCRVIPLEYPNITCRSVDITIPEQGSLTENRLIEQLMVEFTASSPDSVVAYRGNNRWVRSYETVLLNGEGGAKPRLRFNGVYLVTGGLGRIGWILAEYLARALQAKLVLTQLSPFPERETWEEWLATHDEGDEVSRKIRKLRALEDLGAEVLVFAADVADEERMREVFTYSRDHFGALHGVIHAAGVTDDRSVRANYGKGPMDHAWQIRSKVQGPLVLERILRNYRPDFCLLFSSLSSILGGPGFVPDRAANMFMDAFAHKQNRTSSMPWISVNWDGWILEPDDARSAGSATAVGLTAQDVVEAFRRLVSIDNVSQIIVSTGDLQARITQAAKAESLPKWRGSDKNAKSPLRGTPGSGHPSVAGSAEARNPSPIESKIAEIWVGVLKLDDVSVDDNFFELGGQSILAIQVVERINQAFQVNLTMRTIFDEPTIGGLAVLVEEFIIDKLEAESDQILTGLEQEESVLA